VEAEGVGEVVVVVPRAGAEEAEEAEVGAA